MSAAPPPVSAIYSNGERVPEQLVLDEAERLRMLFTADPNEITNQFSTSNSYIAAMQTAMASLIRSELQAQFTQNITYGVNPSNSNGISLTPVLAAAQTAYNYYIAPPSGVTWPLGNSSQGEYDIIAPGSFTFDVNATSVQPGPTLALWDYDLQYYGQPGYGNKPVAKAIIPQTGSGAAQPFSLSYTFQEGDIGTTFSLQLANPGGSYVYQTYTVVSGN